MQHPIEYSFELSSLGNYWIINFDGPRPEDEVIRLADEMAVRLSDVVTDIGLIGSRLVRISFPVSHVGIDQETLKTLALSAGIAYVSVCWNRKIELSDL